VSVKNDEIVSGLKLGLGEVFSKFETLEVEFEAFICPGNFGFLGDLSFREIVTQQLEHVDRPLKVLVGFLRRRVEFVSTQQRVDSPLLLVFA
jgi:hypothetical protein